MNNAFEFFGIERCAAHQRSIDVWLCHKGIHRIGGDAATVLKVSKEGQSYRGEQHNVGDFRYDTHESTMFVFSSEQRNSYVYQEITLSSFFIMLGVTMSYKRYTFE